MKLVLDERFKHRLIGLAVIISIAAIFTPAMVRKSNQKLDEQTQLSIHIPPKPTLPRVVMPDEEAMFKETKLTRLDIPAPPEKPALVVARATPLHAPDQESASQSGPQETLKKSEGLANNATNEATLESSGPPAATQTQTTPSRNTAKTSAKLLPPSNPSSTKLVTLQKKRSLMAQKKSSHEKLALSAPRKMPQKHLKNKYGIQIASFMQQKNAIALTAKLRAQGYPTAYQTIQTHSGPRYKVIVGQLPQKAQAKLLQKQLASTLQLNGLIINGVS